MKHGKMYLKLNFSLHFPLHIKLDDQLGDLLTAVVSEDAEVGTIVNVDMGLSYYNASAWVILQTWRKVVLLDKVCFNKMKNQTSFTSTNVKVSSSYLPLTLTLPNLN